jgi:hypothetical protein
MPTINQTGDVIYVWAFFNSKFKARKILCFEGTWDILLLLLYSIHFIIVLSMQGQCQKQTEFCSAFGWLALWFFLITFCCIFAVYLDWKSWFSNSKTAGANDVELGGSFRRSFMRS